MFENQVKEFAELMGADVQQVYNEMRRTAIMETDLSGFGRILKDLKEIEDISRFDAVLLRDNLIDPYVTYEELGNALAYETACEVLQMGKRAHVSQGGILSSDKKIQE